MSNSQEEDPVVRWVVRFDLPFMVSIDDSFEDARLREWATDPTAASPPPYSPRPTGQGTVVGTPWHIPNPHTLARPVEVDLHGPRVLLSFLRRVRNTDVPIIAGGELRPCYGHSAFTSVQAEIDRATSKGIGEMFEARKVAVEALNRFLETYRSYTGSYWAQPIGVDTVAQCELDSYHASGKVTPGRSDSSPPGGPLRGFGLRPLVSGTVESKIRASAADPSWTATVAFEVVSLARDHLVRGRFRNAVVDSATAFEIFLAAYIRALAGVRGLTDAEAEELMKRKDGHWKDVSDLAKQTLRYLQVDFAGTAEHRKWSQDVRKTRNDLVHGAITTATRETALSAVDAAESAVKKLQELSPGI